VGFKAKCVDGGAVLSVLVGAPLSRRVRPFRILMSVDMMNWLYWSTNLLSSNRLKKGSDFFLFLFILIPNNLFNASIFDYILTL
jgi:hypothetical protein